MSTEPEAFATTNNENVTDGVVATTTGLIAAVVVMGCVLLFIAFKHTPWKKCCGCMDLLVKHPHVRVPEPGLEFERMFEQLKKDGHIDQDAELTEHRPREIPRASIGITGEY
jgi:hypothetical protein